MKILLILLASLCLTGCTATETPEGNYNYFDQNRLNNQTFKENNGQYSYYYTYR